MIFERCHVLEVTSSKMKREKKTGIFPPTANKARAIPVGGTIEKCHPQKLKTNPDKANCITLCEFGERGDVGVEKVKMGRRDWVPLLFFHGFKQIAMLLYCSAIANIFSSLSPQGNKFVIMWHRSATATAMQDPIAQRESGGEGEGMGEVGWLRRGSRRELWLRVEGEEGRGLWRERYS